jgi:multidrug resistance protein, MATE family
LTTTQATDDLRLSISNRQILKIALPISFAILVPQLNFITNNIFLGGLGEHSLAAAGITGVYYLIFAVIGVGLNNGLQALISRRAGENKADEIGKLFSQAIRISLCMAVAGILITYVASPYILEMSMRSATLREQCISFLKIRIWGLPFLYIYQMRNALLVGTNQSRFLMIGAVVETVMNIFFDYGLIYGKFGLPEMGFNGAAYASIIAECSGMLAVFAVIRYKGISSRFQLFRHFRFDATVSRLILVQSSPLIFQHAISIITWQFFYIMMEHHGARALAISNTMRNIFGIFGVFSWAFAATTNTMVSNIIGQGMEDKVSLLLKKIIRLSASFGLLFCILLNVYAENFLSIFGQEEGFITAAIPVVQVVSSALVIMSFATVWLNAVTGTGNTRINLLIEIAAIICYGIYTYLVLEVFNMSIVVGWMSEWLYWLIILALSFMYMRSGKWKGRKI